MRRPICHRCGNTIFRDYQYEYVGGEPFHPGCAEQVRKQDEKRNHRLKLKELRPGAFREIMETMKQRVVALKKKEEI